MLIWGVVYYCFTRRAFTNPVQKMPSFTVYSYLEAAVESAINIAPGFPASSVVCSCALKCFESPYQWDFQDPKLEVPTIYKAYVRPM